jgi:holo-[acyl-carrier protein] synthase
VSVVGLGVDVVDMDRFRTVLARRPRLAERVFTEGERRYAFSKADPVPRLAARFAAKEATMKALGVGLGAFRFADAEVVRAPSGEPSIRLGGRAVELAGKRGATRLMLTMTHSDLIAVAFVVAESDTEP